MSFPWRDRLTVYFFTISGCSTYKAIYISSVPELEPNTYHEEDSSTYM